MISSNLHAFWQLVNWSARGAKFLERVAKDGGGSPGGALAGDPEPSRARRLQSVKGGANRPALFTPCKDGITHNEAEHIELAYTLPGVNVLLNAVVARADR